MRCELLFCRPMLQLAKHDFQTPLFSPKILHDYHFAPQRESDFRRQTHTIFFFKYGRFRKTSFSK